MVKKKIGMIKWVTLLKYYTKIRLTNTRYYSASKCPPVIKKKDAPKAAAAGGAKAKPKDEGDPHKVFTIYRFGGTSEGHKPKTQQFELDTRTCGKMVLDALIRMKTMDPSLTFRRSCREGICGSCAINLQGMNRLACITRIPKAKKIKIYPIPHMYVIRDLVVDMDHFTAGYDSIKPYLIRKQDIEMGKQQFAQSINDNVVFDGLYECVLCSCCSTACPSYWWNGRRFLGPATLMHAYRWIIDSRDEATTQRLRALRDDFKAFRCHAIFQGTVSCPKGLDPCSNVQKLKRLIAGVSSKKIPEMEPMKFINAAGKSSGGGSKGGFDDCEC